jgi:FkbM family methyltransferase
VTCPDGIFACPPAAAPFFLAADRSYEPALRRLIDGISGGVFVDVGASVGFITARAARHASHVIAIEPHPVRFAYLQRNVARNGLTNVTCVNCAVGSSEGVVTLYDLDPALGPHALDVSTTPGAGRRHEVAVRRIDDIVDGDVQFVKIDVEGDEELVLDGARRLLESQPTLVVECLDPQGSDRLRARLPGYRFEAIDDTNVFGVPAETATTVPF